MADTITEPMSPTSPLSGGGSFNFSAFDPSLGTLTGISLDITTWVTGGVVAYNTSNSPLDFDGAGLGISMLIQSPGLDDFTDFFASTAASINSKATIAANGQLTFDTIPVETTFSPAISVSSAFIGTPGSVTPEFQVRTQSGRNPIQAIGCNTPGIFCSGEGYANISAALTYTYTASDSGSKSTGTPEPATLSLLAGGLFGIGFLARKRAKI